jgi:ketosteroid isomerase-like protein
LDEKQRFAQRAAPFDTAGAMSQENVELVRSLHPPSGTDLVTLFAEGLGSGRFDSIAAVLTLDFEAAAGDVAGGLTIWGRGVDGLIKAWRNALEPWEVYRTEVEEFIDAGEDRVVVLVRDHGRVHGSDAEVDVAGGSVWTLRDGKVARIEFHARREDALEAAGLLK